MPGPNGERCIDCIKFDPSQRVCRARAPMPMVGLVGKKHELVLPAVMVDDYCVNDFVAAEKEVSGEA